MCKKSLKIFQTLKGSGRPNAANVEAKSLQQAAHTIT
jgi:hypothetical protein